MVSAAPFTTSLWPFMNQNWSCEGRVRHHSPPACGRFWSKTGVLKRMGASPFTHRPLAIYEAKLEPSSGWAPHHSPIGRWPFMKQSWSSQGDERLTIHPSAAGHLWSTTRIVKGERLTIHPSAFGHLWSNTGVVKDERLTIHPLAIYEPKQSNHWC